MHHQICLRYCVTYFPLAIFRFQAIYLDCDKHVGGMYVLVFIHLAMQIIISLAFITQVKTTTTTKKKCLLYDKLRLVSNSVNHTSITTKSLLRQFGLLIMLHNLVMDCTVVQIYLFIFFSEHFLGSCLCLLKS